MEKNIKKKAYICITESLCRTAEINTNIENELMVTKGERDREG